MAKYVKQKIYQFCKTKHFYKSAFERAIHDELLEWVLRFYQDQNKKKVVAVFPKSFLEKHNLENKGHLVIIIKFNKLLITTYWCEDVSKLKTRKEHVVKFPENKKINQYTTL